MKTSLFWLKVLNVHVSEWRVVKKLFWLQFFQGAGISFFFTAEFARFLDRFPVNRLPWVMVIAAFLLWLTGLVYTVLEHRISFRPFNQGIIVLMAFSMLLVRVGSNFFEDDWFYYFSLAWFYVLYLLNNLEFWGISARLFDIRQSKRLFGVISAGDIPAKFIGYTLALIFVSYTGTLNLLIIGFACMLLSIPFFNSIARTESAHFSSGRQQKHIHQSEHPISNLLADFRSNRIIRSIALISLLASACIIIVNYGLYAKVREAYNSDVELAKFIALFMASLRIAALITKTIFTGRLTTNIGVRQSLFITPTVLIVLMGAILVTYTGMQQEKTLFYLFGATSIAVDVLRTAINSPVLLTVMQPLHTHERLRAHNIVKGIMDPFATLFCGLLLLMLYNVQQEINLITLCYILLGLSMLWIIGIIQVNRDYLNMLVKTISSRFFSQEDFSLNDPETIQQIKHKIETGTDSEVLCVLNMVGTKQNPISIELLSHFLDHSSTKVKIEAIRLIAANRVIQLQAKLDELMLKDSDPAVKKEAIKTISLFARDYQELNGYLNHPEPAIFQAALTGMLANSNKQARNYAANALSGMIHSDDQEVQLNAIAILAEVKDEYQHPEHALLIASANPEVRRAALQAVGKLADAGLLQALLGQLPNHQKEVLKSVQHIGKSAVPHIKQVLELQHCPSSIRGQLINTCGLIGGAEANALLLKMLMKYPSGSPAIIQALYRGKYRADTTTRAYFEELARAYIRFAVELLNMQKALTGRDQPSRLLFNAVQIELQEIREILLCLFACIYDRERIRKARNGFYANHRETLANAMEIIELTVRKELAKYFNTLYEPSSIEHRCESLRFLFTETTYGKADQVLGRILSEKPIKYHDWTKACSMYVSKKYLVPVDLRLMDKYLVAENPLLKETAHYVCN